MYHALEKTIFTVPPFFIKSDPKSDCISVCTPPPPSLPRDLTDKTKLVCRMKLERCMFS